MKFKLRTYDKLKMLLLSSTLVKFFKFKIKNGKENSFIILNLNEFYWV